MQWGGCERAVCPAPPGPGPAVMLEFSWPLQSMLQPCLCSDHRCVPNVSFIVKNGLSDKPWGRGDALTLETGQGSEGTRYQTSTFWHSSGTPAHPGRKVAALLNRFISTGQHHPTSLLIETRTESIFQPHAKWPCQSGSRQNGEWLWAPRTEGLERRDGGFVRWKVWLFLIFKTVCCP